MVAAHFMGWRLERAQVGREVARDDAVGRGLEVQGSATVQAKQGELTAAMIEQRKQADALNAQAHRDPAASAPLPDSVRDRVRAGDRELCKSGPCR